MSAEIETSANFVNGTLTLWEDEGGGNLLFQGNANILPSPSPSPYSPQTFKTIYITSAMQGTGNVILDFGFWGTSTGQWIRFGLALSGWLHHPELRAL